MPSPMPGNSISLARSLGQLFDRFGQAAEEFRGAFVAAVAADHGAVDFQQLRRFPQNAGDFTIFHVRVPRFVMLMWTPAFRRASRPVEDAD